MSARPSTETVVFGDRAIPDQIPPGRRDGDEDVEDDDGDDGDEDMEDDGDGDGDEDMGDGDHYVHPD